MKDKRATTEWTISKLMSLILGVILLALIIYGFTNKSFEPLKDKTINAFNELLIMLNIKDAPPTAYDCNDRVLSIIPGGAEFLKSLNLVDKTTIDKDTFRLCGGECKVHIEGLGDYRIGSTSDKKATNFDKWSDNYYDYIEVGGSNWYNPFSYGDAPKTVREDIGKGFYPYDDYMREEKVVDAEFYWKLFNAIMNGLNDKEKEVLKKFFESKVSKDIVLYGDGALSWFDTPQHARLSNGIWTVSDDKTGDVWYSGPDTLAALAAFKNQVNDGYDDDVSYSESSVPGEDGTPVKPLSEIAGSNNKLDENGEVTILANYISSRVKLLTKRVELTDSDLTNLIENIDKKKFSLDGKEYTMSIGEYKGSPIPTIYSDGKEVYGLVFESGLGKEGLYSSWLSNQKESGSVFYPTWDYNMVFAKHVVDKAAGKDEWTKVGNQRDYKLINKEDFDNFERIKKIRDFLLGVCRVIKPGQEVART